MAKLSVTILGSGTSQGVPLIACDCAVCRSTDPRDKRMRCSIYVDDGIAPFVVDTTPEFRIQCLANEIRQLSAVLITHPHADHFFGFDDLRRFSDLLSPTERLPVYGSEETLERLRMVYDYAFDPASPVLSYLRAEGRPFPETGDFLVGSVTVTPLEVEHGRAVTHGFLFQQEGKKRLAYIPDCKRLPAVAFEAICGVDTLIIDGLRDEPHPTHLTVGEAVEIGRAVGARDTILTHLTHHKSHVEREAGLPPGFRVAYDGMKLEL